LTRDEQLAWERRTGRFAGIAAFGSALLGLASLSVGASARSDQTIDDRVEKIIFDHDHSGVYMTSSWLQAVSIALLGLVLYYLFRVTRSRRAELAAPFGLLGAALPPLVGAFTVVNAIAYLDAADRVIPKLPLPPEAAIDLVEKETLHGTAATVGYVGSAFTLALAFTIGIISVNARRAGVLSSFMGIIGVIVGALLVLGSLFGMPPIVQYFWVTALGLLFLDRWPGQRGRGPAWESGEAEPWLTAAEVRAQEAGGGGGRPGRGREVEEPEDDDYSDDDEGYDDEVEPAAAGTPHPRSKKRKRKRRR
jgi:hypothetical protein